MKQNGNLQNNQDRYPSWFDYAIVFKRFSFFICFKLSFTSVKSDLT